MTQASPSPVEDSSQAPPPFYVPEGGLYLPSPVTASPWDKSLQSGFAMAGLLASALERVPAPQGACPASFKMDVLRPAPRKPSTVITRVLREARKFQLAQAVMQVDGVDVATATLVRFRHLATPVPGEGQGLQSYPPPQAGVQTPGSARNAHLRPSTEMRFLRGAIKERGPATVWLRLAQRIVADRPTSPFVCAAVFSDYGSGLSNVLDGRQFMFANVDLTLHLNRQPVGEWILIDSTTATGGEGYGLTSSVLADLDGEFGRAHQTLIVDPVGRPG
ncbi:MAG: thioesterase family protein [Gammaproteobacteria bacterium]